MLRVIRELYLSPWQDYDDIWHFRRAGEEETALRRRRQQQNSTESSRSLKEASVKATLHLCAAISCIAVVMSLFNVSLQSVRASGPEQPGMLNYDKDGNFILPKNYREWTFLSAGIDMAYGPNGVAAAGKSVFDNVFVDPEAYRSFLAHGTWPDKTVMVLEVRSAETNVSINHGGHSQGEVTGIEIHLKDSARFPSDKWAFFDVKPAGVGTLIPKSESCYACHQEHAAVDTTFVQFYPTLLPLAREKGTLSPKYLKEIDTAAVR